MKIIVNGKAHEFDGSAIDYLSATALAYPGSPNVLYTVTYRRPDSTSGTLAPSQRTAAVEGIVINVMYTGRA